MAQELCDTPLRFKSPLNAPHLGLASHSAIGSEVFIACLHSQTQRPATPNDPKLSGGGAWRGACPTVERTETPQM